MSENLKDKSAGEIAERSALATERDEIPAGYLIRSKEIGRASCRERV